MIRNYLKIVIRNLNRQKSYSMIKIGGLCVGMAVCILMLLYVVDELSFDRFHGQPGRIYRVTKVFGSGDSPRPSANTSYPIAPALKSEFPEVVEAVRFRKRYRPLIRHEDKQFWEQRFCLVDTTFLKVFSFELLQGDPRTALSKPNSVVITESTAERYFGRENPMGKVLIYNHDIEYQVTGVVRDLSRTHFQFDFIAPIESLDGPFERWTTFVNNYTYVVLESNASAPQLESKLPAFIERHVGAELAEQGYRFDLNLQKLTDIHLRSQLAGEIKPSGNLIKIYLFCAIAFFILVIACINFMNLATARALGRAREVAMRKVIGARRAQIIAQFLGESMILSLISFVLAVGLVQLLLPFFNTLTGKNLALVSLDTTLLLGLVAIVLFVGLAAGSYPAFFLSAFRPVTIIKGKTGRSQGSLIRQGLVTFQFAISIALLICSGVVYQQMEFIRKKDLGFTKEQVVVVSLGSQVKKRAEVIKRNWLQSPNVVAASASLLVPSGSLWTWGVVPEGMEKEVEVGTYMVDYDFVGTYKMDIVAGRDFSRSFATDAQEAFLINETAMRQFGWESPDAALGKQLNWDGTRSGRVIGVLRDFNIGSLHETIAPVVFLINPDYYFLSARIKSEDMNATLGFLKETWAEYVSHLPFEYFFLDKRFESLHRADQKLGTTVTYFSAIAVIIACLGLLGLSAFMAQQRIKEVGIRKVLGASSSSVVSLFAKATLGPVILANVIAWPVAYLAMQSWLQDFAYRTDIDLGVFLLAGGAALMIALMTISFQAIKASVANPIETLRYE